MGIALLRMLPKRPLQATVAYAFAFAISSPVGIGIGIAIDATTQGQTANWTYAISMGLACGIFIYVAINHLMAKGYKPQSECYFDTPFFKFLAVLFGVTVLAIAMIWDWHWVSLFDSVVIIYVILFCLLAIYTIYTCALSLSLRKYHILKFGLFSCILYIHVLYCIVNKKLTVCYFLKLITSLSTFIQLNN